MNVTFASGITAEITDIIESRPLVHEGETIWVASYRDEPGIYGMGKDADEAVADARDAMALWRRHA